MSGEPASRKTALANSTASVRAVATHGFPEGYAALVALSSRCGSVPPGWDGTRRPVRRSRSRRARRSPSGSPRNWRKRC